MDIDSWLQEILPFGYEYIIKEAVKNDETLTATIRANIFCEADAVQWLEQFEALSKLSFRVSRTYIPTENKLLYKKDYFCHHNTRASYSSSHTKIPSAKHTNCPAFLRITLKNPKMKRSKDEHLKTHPCEIFLKNNHNHPFESPEVLRHRRPNKNTMEKVLQLFLQGYSPSAALKLLKCELQEQYGSEYMKYASDGAVCPSLPWMYHFYYSTFKKRCRDSSDKYIRTVEYVENEQHLNTTSEVLSDNMGICSSLGNEDVFKKDILLQDKENNTTEEKLGNMFDTLKSYLEDPEVFSAVVTFLDNFEKIDNKEHLVTSLKMFGILTS